MRNLKLIAAYSIILLVAVGSLLFSQTQMGTIIGTVIDENGAPLPNVSVTLEGPIVPMVSYTDELGYYRFVNLPPGTYKLTYILTGFTVMARENIRITTYKFATRVNVTFDPEAPEIVVLVPPELSEIIEYELNKLVEGKILFNPPQEMKVDVRERVEVRITKTFIEDLSAGLRGRGVPQIRRIRVNKFMTVRLMGHNFDIKPLSHEEQLVAGEGFTQWEWDVVPLKSGIQWLLLSVAVRIKIPDYDEETIDYPVFERKIKVKVNIITWFAKHWKLFLTTIIAPIIVGIIVAWLVHKLRGSKKK